MTMPVCLTNIADVSLVPIYEAAIKETGLPLWIGDASSLGDPDWKGLWCEDSFDCSPFWRAAERLSKMPT